MNIARNTDMFQTHFFWLAFSLVHLSASYPEGMININTLTPVHKTDKRFFSLGMDSNLIRDRWETFDFNSVRLMTLAQGLQPAYLRLMGTDGDRMTFHFNTSAKIKGIPPFPDTNFIMTAKDWDSINQFCVKAGWRLMFGFNGQIRYKTLDGTAWDPSNAMEILDYSVKRGYHKNLDFELGNEPCDWAYHPGQVKVSGKQLAADFNTLRKVLDTFFTGYYENSIIVGPGSAYNCPTEWEILQGFLDNVGNAIHATTWHHYYGGGEINHSDNYTDPKILDSYMTCVKDVQNHVHNTSQPNIKIWNGESGSTVYPSGTGLEETFAATFMLLDKNGLSGILGMDVVVRQTFYGFWFALVNEKLMPTPNYWIALYFKRLVGNIVLDVTTTVSKASNVPKKLRLYAHCTQDSSLYPSSSGSITVYGMNVFDEDVYIIWNQNINASLTEVHQYLFTAAELPSKNIYLNGEKVSMISDTQLPNLHPKILKPTDQFLLPAMSLVYYVLPGVNAAACQG